MEYAENKVIIIDSIGLLSSLYRYGNIAYIGGGFGTGIHNILEAATYGKPIVFGHNHRKFKEATDLIQLEAAFSGENYAEIEKIIASLYFQADFRKNAGTQASQYVENNVGATEKIWKIVNRKSK